jgi:hypothetical protein
MLTCALLCAALTRDAIAWTALRVRVAERVQGLAPKPYGIKLGCLASISA